MKGHIKKRGDRYYAVIYEGLDPVTGKERRTWHPAGTDRADAERLAESLAAAETKRIGKVRALTFGAFLTSQWLPAKKLQLATSTYRGYERNVVRHILPVLGRTSPCSVGRASGGCATSRSNRSTTHCSTPPKAKASHRRPSMRSTSSSAAP